MSAINKKVNAYKTDPLKHDTDGNGIHTSKMTYRRMAADNFINSMALGNKASIVTFDNHAEVVAPMTPVSFSIQLYKSIFVILQMVALLLSFKGFFTNMLYFFEYLFYFFVGSICYRDIYYRAD